jgi:hypothetical protein
VEVTGEWRKVYNEELRDFYSSKNTVLFGQSSKGEGTGRRMWQVCGRTEIHAGFWWGNLKERGHIKDLNVDTRII